MWYIPFFFYLYHVCCFAYKENIKDIKGIIKSDTKYYLNIYNISQICINLILSIVLFYSINNYKTFNSNTIELILLFTFFSRIYDWCDTFFIIVKRNWKQLNTLHVGHHALMPSFLLWVYINEYQCNEYFFNLGLNSFVHVVMYTHYYLSSKKYKNPFKKYITIMQLLQFCLLMISNIHGLFFSSFPSYAFIVCIIINVWLLVMFGRFYRKEYKKI